MRFFRLAGIWLFLAAAAFSQSFTHIVDTLNDASGNPYTGSLQINWRDSGKVEHSMEVQVAAGALDIKLAPSVPGQVYTVTGQVGTASFVDTWWVPSTASTLTLTNIRGKAASGGGGASPAGSAVTDAQCWASASTLGVCAKVYLTGTPTSTVSQLYAGPNESTLPALIQGYASPASILITKTYNSASGMNLGIEYSGGGTGIFVAGVSSAAGANPFANEADMYAGADGATPLGYYSFCGANGFHATECDGFWVQTPDATGGLDISQAFYANAQGGRRPTLTIFGRMKQEYSASRPTTLSIPSIKRSQRSTTHSSLSTRLEPLTMSAAFPDASGNRT